MAYTVVVHIANADPFLAEIEEVPEPQDNFLQCSNPRSRDGKSLHYVDEEAVSLIFPWHRVSFVEIMPSEAEREEVETFFRE
ncbi:MAG: hypothetical protein B6I34_05685 [Anaerolineaceae bacterium 4572_32.1]|nr:MAG: hypothetical protein B6I34_05685 [Anaerolineaceae bacterium 4572_32.1]